MLSSARCHAAMPASDLERARRFYETTLGLTPAQVAPGGILYDAGAGSRFLVFPSGGRAAGTHTQLGFSVDDIEAEVAELRARGVTFETYDMRAMDPATAIATFPGSRSAWFKDSEGNLIGMVQLTTK